MTAPVRRLGELVHVAKVERIDPDSVKKWVRDFVVKWHDSISEEERADIEQSILGAEHCPNDVRFFAAQLDGELLGIAIWRRYAGSGFELAWDTVKGSARRQGVNSKLISDRIADISRLEAAADIWTTVSGSCAPQQYKAFGFKVKEVLEGKVCLIRHGVRSGNCDPPPAKPID